MRLSGSNLAYFAKNTTFSGFNQKVKVDTRGDVKTNYVILDSDNMGSQLYQTHMLDLTSGRLRFAGRSINFPRGAPPPSDSSCWFDKKAICTGGKRVHFGTCVHSCSFMNVGACGYVWMCLVRFSQHHGMFSILCAISSSSSSDLLYIIIKLPVVILRCGGHLHHSGVCRHLRSGCRRACHRSLYQVQPLNVHSNSCSVEMLESKKRRLSLKSSTMTNI